MKSIEFILWHNHVETGLTCSWWEFNVEQVFETTVPSQNSIVRHSAGPKHQATLLHALRVVSNHSEHIEVTALLHVWADLDGEL